MDIRESNHIDMSDARNVFVALFLINTMILTYGILNSPFVAYHWWILPVNYIILLVSWLYMLNGRKIKRWWRNKLVEAEKRRAIKLRLEKELENTTKSW